jgi:polyketide cyclase/dehydrase/lipid transport protein
VARVLVSAVIDAPIAQVWGAIRGFDAVAELLPFVQSSPIEEDREPTAVGAVRVVTQTDGAVFREVLVAHSDPECFYSYTFVGSPIPVRDHRTTLRLHPITDGDRTLGEWSSRFTIAAEREAELVGLMEKNFLAGLRSVNSRLGRTEQSAPR